MRLSQRSAAFRWSFCANMGRLTMLAHRMLQHIARHMSRDTMQMGIRTDRSVHGVSLTCAQAVHTLGESVWRMPMRARRQCMVEHTQEHGVAGMVADDDAPRTNEGLAVPFVNSWSRFTMMTGTPRRAPCSSRVPRVRARRSWPWRRRSPGCEPAWRPGTMGRR